MPNFEFLDPNLAAQQSKLFDIYQQREMQRRQQMENMRISQQQAMGYFGHSSTGGMFGPVSAYGAFLKNPASYQEHPGQTKNNYYHSIRQSTFLPSEQELASMVKM